MQMVRRASSGGIRLTPQQIFQHQTISGLAVVAVREPAAGTQTVPGAVLVDEPLSDDDMTKILAQIGRVRSQ
jgi:hypothetical protein